MTVCLPRVAFQMEIAYSQSNLNASISTKAFLNRLEHCAAKPNAIVALAVSHQGTACSLVQNRARLPEDSTPDMNLAAKRIALSHVRRIWTSMAALVTKISSNFFRSGDGALDALKTSMGTKMWTTKISFWSSRNGALASKDQF